MYKKKETEMFTKEAKAKLEETKALLDKGEKIVVEMEKKTKQIVLNVSVDAQEEIDVDFLQGMVNRMVVSFFKYGKVEEGYGKDGAMDAIESLKLRLKAFEEGNEAKNLKKGNVEMLMDVANFAMIGFMFPREGEYFEATDSNKSVGRVTKSGHTTERKN